MATSGALTGKVVLVTGGGRGIGRAVAIAMAKAGASVAVASRTQRELDQTVALIQAEGGRAEGFVLDVGDSKAVRAVFEKIEHVLGPVDVLVNNAGVVASGAAVDMEDCGWKKVFDVNVHGVFWCAREALRQMTRCKVAGSIINVSSLAGIRGTEKYPGFAAYTASKHAVIGVTEALAVEAAALGIRVNCIAPGAVDTQMLKAAAPGLKTNTRPQDIVGTFLFLADSLQSGSVNGAVIELNTNA